MHGTLTTLIYRLQDSSINDTDVIKWGAPVPSFGDATRSKVATLGLNPSNREFVDEAGKELKGGERRFHSLDSLGISSWDNVEARHLEMIINSCISYFQENPYDRWFKKLDRLIAATDTSYYSEMFKACHLDLIPYATFSKWTYLNNEQRSNLIEIAGDTLGLLLRESPIEVLILNGKSVVDYFEVITQTNLKEQEMPEWFLPRENGPDVPGVAFSGVVEKISGVKIGREIKIFGYNHNIQSSFGVTNEVVNSISKWISKNT